MATALRLSDRVLAAIAAIDSPADLRLRTSLRRDDVDVWTTFLPVSSTYETLLQAPPVIARAMHRRGWSTDVVYRDRDAAIAGHEVMCGRALEVLAALRLGDA